MFAQINAIKTGDNIVYLMKKNKVTINQLQDILNLNTPVSISRWRNGHCLPSIDNLVILAQVFNVKIDDILVIE